MITRMTSRSAACLLALALFGALAATSIRLDAVSQETAAPADAGIDVSALTATAGKTYLPLLAVRDPI